MWNVLDKELRPLPNQLVEFRPGMQCLDIISFLVESLRKADEWGEKLFVVSMDMASAFDSVSAQVLGDVLLERGATTISAAAAVMRIWSFERGRVWGLQKVLRSVWTWA